MTTTMTKEQLVDKVGKNGFLADDKTLAAKLHYDSGIPSFDEYLDGKTVKQIGAVIHLTKHPKGLAIKIAKNFSSFPFGLAFTEIKRTVLSETANISHLIFDTTDGKIIFSVKSSDTSEVKEFLKDIHLKYDIDKVKVESKQSQAVVEVDRNPVPAYIAIVSALLIVIGCFMPWIQLGALFQNRGMDNPDGAVMLVTAVIAGAVAVFNLSKKENKNTWVFIVAGLIGGAVFYYDITEVNSRANTIKEGVDKLSNLFGGDGNTSKLNFIGSGLYIVALGSVGLILSGLGLFKQATPETTDETATNEE